MKTVNGWFINSLLIVLLGGALTLSGWQLHKTNAVGEAVVGLDKTTALGKEARLTSERLNDEAHKAILTKLDLLVPRTEHELRDAAIQLSMKTLEAEILQVRERLTAVELRLAVLEAKLNVTLKFPDVPAK